MPEHILPTTRRSNDITTLLEQELAYNHKQYPGFLEEFLVIKVHGMDMTRCFYGYLGQGNAEKAFPRIRRTMVALGGGLSEIEYALFEVRPGDTPLSDTPGGQELRTFKTAIESVLTIPV